MRLLINHAYSHQTATWPWALWNDVMVKEGVSMDTPTLVESDIFAYQAISRIIRGPGAEASHKSREIKSWGRKPCIFHKLSKNQICEVVLHHIPLANLRNTLPFLGI